MRKLDLVVLSLVLLVGAAVAFVLVPRGRFDTGLCSKCTTNLRNILGLMEFGSGWEGTPGEMVEYLVRKGGLEGDALDLLYCPGDTRPRGEGHFTSYAFRVGKGVPGGVLIADDSEDHHGGKGFVVGYADGTVKWRDKRDDWGIDYETKVTVGPDSIVPELRCLAK